MAGKARESRSHGEAVHDRPLTEQEVGEVGEGGAVGEEGVSEDEPSGAPSLQPTMYPLSKLSPAPWNPRLITEEGMRSLCRAIAADPAFMWVRPIAANASGLIYAGNQRYHACKRLGWTEAPTIITDIPDDLARTRAIVDNNHWGRWDRAQVATLLASLKRSRSITDLGWDEDHRKRFLELHDRMVGQEAPLRHEVIIECSGEEELHRMYDEVRGLGATVRTLIL